MKNRKLLLIVSLVLALTMSLGGTLAYLTDTDADVNVMTLGNVKIEQHEYQRAKDEKGDYEIATIDNQDSYVLEPFEQGKPLLPSTEIDEDGKPVNNGAGPHDTTIVRMTQVDSYGSMQVFTSENAVDKFVTVENTGKTDAYVRTIVAIEVGSTDGSLLGLGVRCVDLEKYPNDVTTPWTSTTIGKVEIDGSHYIVREYLYRGASDVPRHDNGVLPAGDTTYPNLCQVYLKAIATNEDMVAIDGNGNGTLDILVVSQAVQAAGFADAQIALDAAFGDVTTESHPWMDGQTGDQEPDQLPIPKPVSSVDELVDAVTNAASGDVILLTEDVTLEETLAVPAGVTLNLDGVKINGTVKALGDLNINGNAYIKTLNAVNGGEITVEDGKTLELNNFSFGSQDTSTSEYTITGGKITANYGFFQHGTYELHSDFETGYMYYSYGSDITVYGTFHSQGKGDGLDYVRGKLTIADGGKSIHDAALWVGQPASWGAMEATLIVEEGGSVQANSLSIHHGSKLQIDAANMQAGEVTSINCGKISNDGTVEAVNNATLVAEVSDNKIILK